MVVVMKQLFVALIRPCVLANKQLTGALIVEMTNLFIELLKNKSVYKFEFSVKS